ncbi:endoribonuclease YbeY-like [Corticium candelabrum]|uniref:endoribonuclease YbeY-like n=1 Tax=Corticium candelabrum TaxID=121492 RepID=UPI002E26E17C|nr:endoribonuclease YbeY-like [Corticium candelabrum]
MDGRMDGWMVMYPGNVPQSSGSWDTSLGDLVLALPYIQQQCKEENNSLDERMPILLCRGLCHPLGYTQTTRHNWQLMVKRESSLLQCYKNAFGTCLQTLTICEEY